MPTHPPQPPKPEPPKPEPPKPEPPEQSRPQRAARARVRAKVPPASPADLPRDLLERPAHEGARWLALLRLETLRAAHHGLRDDDDDAVHRFRVALRRLRSTLREHRDLLDDSVSRKTDRRLARLTAAAGARRDVDVHLAWLAEERATLPEVERAGADWLERALRREWRAADAALRRELDRDYVRVVRRLDRRLPRYRLTIELGRPRPIPATRAVLGATIDRLGTELATRLAAMRSIDDVRAIHRTRIAAKRLRYALEPLAARAWKPAAMVRDAGDAVHELRALQDDLGLIHDAHVVSAWLADRAAESAARAARSAATLDADSDESSGSNDAAVQSAVRALESRLRDRGAERWAALDADEHRLRVAQLADRARRIAKRLAATRR